MEGKKAKAICMNCGATNNYPMVAAGKKVVCGKCKNVLPGPGTVLEPPLERLALLLQNPSLPVLIDFYSTTCAPCYLMHPILENLARRRAGEVVVVRLNVEKNTELASRMGIQAVPTFVILFKGYERGRISGAMPETDLSLWVASKT